MLTRSSSEPNEVQAAPAENGYAISIIALTAFLQEGACGRARYVSEQEQCSAVDTLRKLGNDDLASKVEEIFVVRDVIAHAHLWKAKISQVLQFRELPVLLPGYGDRKFERLVDSGSRQTRRLKLDVFPNRIYRSTAVVALKEAADILEFLEEFVHLQQRDVRIGDRFIPFYKWVRELPA